MIESSTAHDLTFSFLCAAVLTTVTAILCPQIIQVLHTPEGICHDADQYLLVIFLGLPFTFFYNMQSSLLRAVGNSRESFLFLVFALGTLRILGFTTICWTHQAAWITAGLYVFLMFRTIIRKTSS